VAEQDNGGPIVQLALSVARMAELMADIGNSMGALMLQQAKTTEALQALAAAMDEHGDDEGAEPAVYLSGKPR